MKQWNAGETERMRGGVLPGHLPLEKRWAFNIFATSLVCVFLLTSLVTLKASVVSRQTKGKSNLTSSPPTPLHAVSDIPRLAYLISGSKGDLNGIWRLLNAIYHPRNTYIVHLDLESPAAERQELADWVANYSLFSTVRNVHMIAKANMITYKGPTMVAHTLHACAILLKKSKNWDWFINLSASDYPLVTQDDLLFALSKLPKNLNFIEHRSRLGWKETKRAMPLIIDPWLYKTVKSNLHLVRQTRELPNAFKLFTGSAWMVLSREFVEFSVLGWDNLPRILLMYYTNFASALEGYFHTIICNSPEFSDTVVNHDLRYISWDSPPKQHPHNLTVHDAEKMVGSNAPFARKFDRGDAALDTIDVELLHRNREGLTAGGWCSGYPLCSIVADDGRLTPGPGSQRLQRLIDALVLSDAFKKQQCK